MSRLNPTETYGPLSTAPGVSFPVHGTVTCKVCKITATRASRTQKDTCGRADCKRDWAKRGGK